MRAQRTVLKALPTVPRHMRALPSSPPQTPPCKTLPCTAPPCKALACTHGLATHRIPANHKNVTPFCRRRQAAEGGARLGAGGQRAGQGTGHAGAHAEGRAARAAWRSVAAGWLCSRLYTWFALLAQAIVLQAHGGKQGLRSSALCHSAMPHTPVQSSNLFPRDHPLAAGHQGAAVQLPLWVRRSAQRGSRRGGQQRRGGADGALRRRQLGPGCRVAVQ